MMATSKKYEYNFVDEPSDKLKCLICLEVADKPKQHETCGKIFCEKCIIQNEGNPCPACNEESPDYFTDTRGAQEIRDLRIRCVNFNNGCAWRGTVRTLEEHMKTTCEFISVPCKYKYIGCDVKMLNKDIEQHEKKDDNKHLHLALESVATPTLSDGESLVIKLTKYSSLKENEEMFHSTPFYTHSNGYKMCLGIDANGKGSGKGTHLSVCAYIIKGPFDKLVDWPFVGRVFIELLNQKSDCNHHGKEIEFENAQPSSSLTCGCSKYILQSMLEESNNTQYLKNDSLYFRVSVKLTNDQPWLTCGKQLNPATSSIWNKAYQSQTFVVDGYNSMKVNNEVFYTSNFFVSPGGYQIYISVHPNGFGSGENSHVSVFIHVVEGPYDVNLSWPFVGSFKLELLNQLADENHYVMNLNITKGANLIASERLGYSNFISHLQLCVYGQKYLKDDALYFRVTTEVADCKPWLTCTLSSEC